MRHRWSTVWLVLVVMDGSLYACSRSPPAAASSENSTQSACYSEQRELYYGIPVRVSFAPANDDLARQVWRDLKAVDDLFNDFRGNSEIGRINADDSGRSREVSLEMADALMKARQFQTLTKGAFDVTVGPLRQLWREAARTGILPTAAKLNAALAVSGKDAWKLNARQLLRKPGVRFDVGGMIKGWAADRAAALLRDGGATDVLVQVGGETVAFGRHHTGRHFRVGVQDPLDIQRIHTAVTAPAQGLSIATSGNYRQPLRIGNRTYYHIFDPRTGQPVDTRVLSVTVAFTSPQQCALADALATAGAVLGPAKILELTKALGGQVLVLVDEDGKVREYKTEGWQALEAPAKEQ